MPLYFSTRDFENIENISPCKVHGSRESGVYSKSLVWFACRGYASLLLEIRYSSMLCLSGLCIPFLSGVDFFLVGQRRNVVHVCFQWVFVFSFEYFQKASGKCFHKQVPQLKNLLPDRGVRMNQGVMLQSCIWPLSLSHTMHDLMIATWPTGRKYCLPWLKLLAMCVCHATQCMLAGRH